MSLALIASPSLASIGSFFQDGIVEPGRLPQFIFLISFLATFAFIRTSAHLIRAQVPWWPGNVEVGGTHIHHLVWGILTLLIVGWFGVVVAPPSPWHEILAALFGIGTGLTLDEFALWLNLRDVYWKKQGRASIDAVIVAAVFAGFAVVGFGAFVQAADEVNRWVFQTTAGYLIILGLLVLANVPKAKFGMAVLAVFLPGIGLIVAAVTAVRVAKPSSIWARRYDKKKKALAKKRFEGRKARPFWGFWDSSPAT